MDKCPFEALCVQWLNFWAAVWKDSGEFKSDHHHTMLESMNNALDPRFHLVSILRCQTFADLLPGFEATWITHENKGHINDLTHAIITPLTFRRNVVTLRVSIRHQVPSHTQSSELNIILKIGEENGIGTSLLMTRFELDFYIRLCLFHAMLCHLRPSALSSRTLKVQRGENSRLISCYSGRRDSSSEHMG